MSNELITEHFHQQKKTATTSKACQKCETYSKTKSNLAATTPSAAELLKKKDLDLLKNFDLTLEYGPCTGITRLQRWDRADRHALSPPQEIRNLIEQNLQDEDYTKSLWKDYEI